MKPKILTFQHKDSAVFNYRFDRPLAPLGAKKRRTLLRKNEEMQLGDLAERLKKQGNIWVIKYIDDFKTLNTLYSLRNIAKTKVIVDIDDNIWNIPFGNIARGEEKANAMRALMVTESIKCADWVTVSTEPLKERILKLNENTIVLPNYIDPKEWKYKRKKHKKIRIGWVWSPTHRPDNAEVEPALKEIKKKYGDKIEIVIFGASTNIFDFDTINIPGVKFDKFPKLFQEAGIDISLGALADNDFNKCKSNIKYLESTMAGAVFIGSKVYPYEKTVVNNKTGFIAKDTKQWVKYISLMIDDAEKRKVILENATKDVLDNHSDGEDWAYFYQEFINEVQKINENRIIK